jgi:hypothetical protein
MNGFDDSYAEKVSPRSGSGLGKRQTTPSSTVKKTHPEALSPLPESVGGSLL